jgi:hypothetical protein
VTAPPPADDRCAGQPPLCPPMPGRTRRGSHRTVVPKLPPSLGRRTPAHAVPAPGDRDRKHPAHPRAAAVPHPRPTARRPRRTRRRRPRPTLALRAGRTADLTDPARSATPTTADPAAGPAPHQAPRGRSFSFEQRASPCHHAPPSPPFPATHPPRQSGHSRSVPEHSSCYSPHTASCPCSTTRRSPRARCRRDAARFRRTPPRRPPPALIRACRATPARSSVGTCSPLRRRRGAHHGRPQKGPSHQTDHTRRAIGAGSYGQALPTPDPEAPVGPYPAGSGLAHASLPPSAPPVTESRNARIPAFGPDR